MSEKVKLTNAQAEKIEKLLEHHTKERIVGDFVTTAEHRKEGLTLDALIRALYIGYEVEETPEGRLIMLVQRYEHRLKTASSAQEAEFYDGKLKGIREALCTLNIEVKGINE